MHFSKESKKRNESAFDFAQPSWFKINDLGAWKHELGSSFPLLTVAHFRCVLRWPLPTNAFLRIGHDKRGGCIPGGENASHQRD